MKEKNHSWVDSTSVGSCPGHLLLIFKLFIYNFHDSLWNNWYTGDNTLLMIYLILNFHPFLALFIYLKQVMLYEWTWLKHVPDIRVSWWNLIKISFSYYINWMKTCLSYACFTSFNAMIINWLSCPIHDFINSSKTYISAITSLK